MKVEHLDDSSDIEEVKTMVKLEEDMKPKLDTSGSDEGLGSESEVEEDLEDLQVRILTSFTPIWQANH